MEYCADHFVVFHCPGTNICDEVLFVNLGSYLFNDFLTYQANSSRSNIFTQTTYKSSLVDFPKKNDDLMTAH